MSTQKKTKEELINFQLKGVELLSSSLQSPKTEFTDQQSFNFNISVEQKLDHNHKSLIVITHVEITTTEDLEYKLAIASIACIFSIENYNDVIKIDNGQIIINPEIVYVLNSISYSTTRGALSQILRGTYLHHAILPIIDPKTFKKIE